ncbi:MAG: transposase [Flavobacteriales bacterium]|nr:transposase [Flavobacteriales bacterium]
MHRHLQWSDRGYMPHVNGPELIQHVSCHLADSLPKEAVAAMDAELKELPPKLRDHEREMRVAAYLDAGYGSCILRVPELADMVQETFTHFAGDRYELHAWCVMPNHVHVLFQPVNGWSMSEIVASWKSYTGRRISEYAKANGMSEGLSAGFVAALGRGVPRGRDATLGRGVPSGGDATLGRGVPSRVWHREYWDRYIRDHAHYMNAVHYIHDNPVKARLVAKAEDWKWSSAYLAALGRGEPNEDGTIGRGEPNEDATLGRGEPSGK